MPIELNLSQTESEENRSSSKHSIQIVHLASILRYSSIKPCNWKNTYIINCYEDGTDTWEHVLKRATEYGPDSPITILIEHKSQIFIKETDEGDRIHMCPVCLMVFSYRLDKFGYTLRESFKSMKFEV